MTDYQLVVQQCETDIRNGQAAQVSKRLSALKLGKIPRAWILPLANVSRRAGLFATGMKILSPVVLGTRNSAGDANAAELAEYGVLLLRSGALPEAQAKLGRVDIMRAPEALLYRSFVHFTCWEFQEAIPLLQNYIEVAPTEYAKMVGRMNLALAYVETRQNDDALKLVAENIRVSEEKNYAQMKVNNHVLRGQVYLHQNELVRALEEIDGISVTGQTNDQFFARKWALITKALMTKDLRLLGELRRLARENVDWDALRLADFYELKLKFDDAGFQHLYFGSPLAGFRRRLELELAEKPHAEDYILGEREARCFDLSAGRIEKVESAGSGRKSHQLIEALLRDFYQPARIGGLFSMLFPSEQFNINSSPNRVHQLIHRTREWIEEEELPLELSNSNGFYSLKINGPLSIRLRIDRAPVDSPRLHFTRLHDQFKSRGVFTAEDVRAGLNLSPASVHRLLHWGLDEKLLLPSGKLARKKLYRFAV